MRKRGRRARARLGHQDVRERYLYVRGELLENIVDLVLKPSTQHLIGFVQHKHFDAFRTCKLRSHFVMKAFASHDEYKRLICLVHTDQQFQTHTGKQAEKKAAKQPQAGSAVFRKSMLIIPPRPCCTVESSQQNAGLVNTAAGVLENQLTRMGFITIQQKGGL